MKNRWPKRIDFEVRNIFIHWLIDNWIGDGCKRLFSLEDFLRFQIQLRAFSNIGCLYRFIKQVFERLVAPLRPLSPPRSVLQLSIRNQLLGSPLSVMAPPSAASCSPFRPRL